MNEFIHFIKHIIGLCGETSHPSLLISGGVFLTSIVLYWKRLMGYMKGLFS
jgi:Na+-transporting NADH:ubiquinone oxidoreductase subunit NqrB